MSDEIKPQPGPQAAFLTTPADIAIYGGAAGGGKTWALAFEAMRFANVPKYSGVIFRRTYPQLVGGGSVWEETQTLYPLVGGISRERVLDWRFPSGAMIEFRHLQYDKDKLVHQGKQYAFIGFDELTQFTESQFWYLFSRNRSMCGVKPYMRASCNPDSVSWVRTLIDWWIGEDGFPMQERAGVLRYFVREGGKIFWGLDRDALWAQHPGLPPISLTFIPAKLSDNQILETRDPTYRHKLLAMPRVEREQLLDGNWDVEASAGSYFNRAWFEMVDHVPRLVETCRGWDRAATEPHEGNRDPDWTRGVKIGRMSDGNIIILDVASARKGPGKIEALVRATSAADGQECTVGIWQDLGGAGVFDVDNIRNVLIGFTVKTEKTTSNKVTFAGPVSSFAEPIGGQHGKILVLRADWNDEFFAELERFPAGGHDDIVDALSLAFMILAGTAGDYGHEELEDHGRWGRRGAL